MILSNPRREGKYEMSQNPAATQLWVPGPLHGLLGRRGPVCLGPKSLQCPAQGRRAAPRALLEEQNLRLLRAVLEFGMLLHAHKAHGGCAPLHPPFCQLTLQALGRILAPAMGCENLQELVNQVQVHRGRRLAHFHGSRHDLHFQPCVALVQVLSLGT